MEYFVYIILCQNETYYTGYTRSIDKRMKLHMNGRGARYTKLNPPTEVAYVECLPSRAEAMRRERAIKKLSHLQKKNLVESQNSRRTCSSFSPGINNDGKAEN